MILECLVESESKEVFRSQNDKGVSKGYRSQLEVAPTSQRWDSLTTNKNNYRPIDYTLNKVTSTNLF